MTTLAYFQGKIVPIEQAQISVMNQTFNYGTGCFGGLRGYWNEDHQQLYVFRIHDHFRRVLQSAKLLLSELPHTPATLAEVTIDLLSREGWRQNCYIRPVVYKADNMLGVRLHDLQSDVAIFSMPVGSYIPAEDGAKACVSSWRRVDDNAIPARGKIIGSYVNSALVKSDAVLNGFDEAIVLNQDGHVAEGSAANFVMIRDGQLIIPPVYANVLEGITLRSIVQLAQAELGLDVVDRPIDRSELYVADEAFFCGTGAQVAVITSIDHRPVGNGTIGPITRSLRDLFFRVVKGEEPKYRHWLTPVPVLESIA
jgi:branched-chain amino acid aminotransferase